MTDHEKRIREALAECSADGDTFALISTADLRALLADLDAVRMKAARYDWLRNSSQICGSMTGRGIAMPSYKTSDAQRTYLDECIDTALKGASHD